MHFGCGTTPFGPAIVMWVLLNVALMWTTPLAMFFLTLRLVDLPMIARLLGGLPYFIPLTDFLPATVLRGPFRVRAFVRVR